MATPTSLPATFVAGNVLTAAQMNDLRGAFRILQIVRATSTSTFATSSTARVDVMSVTITPTSATSSIMLIFTARAWVDNGTNNDMRGNIYITDNANVVISGAEQSTIGTTNLTGTGTKTSHSASPLAIAWDTPATTSATTYKVRAAVTSGASTIVFNGANQTTQLFAIEVSA